MAYDDQALPIILKLGSYNIAMNEKISAFKVDSATGDHYSLESLLRIGIRRNLDFVNIIEKMVIAIIFRCVKRRGDNLRVKL